MAQAPRNRTRTLPIDDVLPEIAAGLVAHNSLVVCAEPGAGKTTRVPVAMLNAAWLCGRNVIMLEPRRLAAQRSAHFMASELGEEVGRTIGYRTRGDTRVSPATRIEIVTEGVLTRMVQSDPSLPGVGLLIFDEFHERSIHADLGLAFALDVQAHLRPDLRVLVMSATLDIAAVSQLLGDAPVIQSQGRSHAVKTHYLKEPHVAPEEPLVVSTILRSLHEDEGDILVFLPGQREIRRVDALLVEKELPDDVIVHALFGDGSPGQQQAALAPPPPGVRKVILSTSIAETSLTIDGVRVVVDSGLARQARFDPRRGMSGLVTTPVSQASADQRRGRAGRQQPGVCYRLWTEREHELLPPFAPPEIRSTDLAPLALEFARWGVAGGEGLRFLDVPPAAHLAQARALLKSLGAIDAEGKLTTHGRAMAEFPLHPRLSHMLLRGKELGCGALACDVAALLEERDLMRGDRDADIDLRTRWHLLKHGGARDRSVVERARSQAAKYRQLVGVPDEAGSDEQIGLMLALAYPERVGKKRGDRYQLAGGSVAMLTRGSTLGREEFLALGEVDGAGAEVTVFLAAPLNESDLMTGFRDQCVSSDDVRWDVRQEAVIARRVTRLGAIELSESTLRGESEAISRAMIEGVRQMGLSCLPWTGDATSLRVRSEWLREGKLTPDDWPDLSDVRLAATLEAWLSPYLHGVMRRAHLDRLSLTTILRARFTHAQTTLLNRLAPTHLAVPTGSRIPIDYSSGQQPVLAVRLQEMFGQRDSPTIADGRVKVLLHLLSPAQRPLAVTRDLASFWRNAYSDVRKEMRGRYPKHYWPENPLDAEPTKRTKRRG